MGVALLLIHFNRYQWFIINVLPLFERVNTELRILNILRNTYSCRVYQCYCRASYFLVIDVLFILDKLS